MTIIGTRTCSVTGLGLLGAASDHDVLRVAKDRSGALTGYPNEHVGQLPSSMPEKRGRFDTLGSTLYFADSRTCAYAEVLTGFRKKRDAVARAVANAGYTGAQVDEFIDTVIEQAHENGRNPPWAIPVAWQMDRSIYEVRLPSQGWWVVIDHPDTLQALAALAPQLGLVFSGDIEGEDRALTTSIAQEIRDAMLDDGSYALGIHFRSKTRMGRCWAYWDRRTDAGLPPGRNDPVQLISENVGPDPSFHEVAKRFQLPTNARSS